MSTTLPRLLVLTDRSQLHLSRSLTSALRSCVSAGATAFVVRELDETPAARAALARDLAAQGVTVIAAHEPLDGAVAVHLPSSAASGALLPSDTRAEVAVTGRYSWFGRSCHSAAEVHAAAAEGAAYVTLGPFARTASKPGYAPIPPSEYAEAATAGIPVYALGGITAANAAEALAAGAHGVAVMGEVMRAAEPGDSVRELLAVVG